MREEQIQNLSVYEKWKEAWLSRHDTLDSAVDIAREQGSEEYAEKLKRLIEEMEGPAVDRIIERRNAAGFPGEQPKDSTEKVR